MTYMQDLEHELYKRLESFAAGDISAADVIAFVKKTVLESYHNGQNAEPRPAPQRNSQDNGQAPQSGRREWRIKKPSAGSAPVRN